jgi:hypothetical protein
MVVNGLLHKTILNICDHFKFFPDILQGLTYNYYLGIDTVKFKLFSDNINVVYLDHTAFLQREFLLHFVLHGKPG